MSEDFEHISDDEPLPPPKPSLLPAREPHRVLVVDHRPEVAVLLATSAPAPYPHLIACATSQNEIKIYDKNSCVVKQIFEGHRSRITCTEFLPF